MNAEMGTDLGPIERPEDQDPETKHKARMAVCRYAVDATDAADLMAMLGLDGAKPLCERCGDPMSKPTNLGRSRRRGEGGVCNTCVKRAEEAVKRADRRARRKAAL